MARKSAPYSPSDDYPVEQEELLSSSTPEPDATSTANEINLKVQHVQEQLLDLKRQQEEVERQKRELEELSRKQREFDEGRREIVEKLTRGLVLLERQEFEVKRELEQIKIVRDSFAEHLGQTENLNPADWSAEELPTELTKALARVDQAKSIFSQSRARLVALRQAEEGGQAEIATEFAPDLAPVYEKTFGMMVRDGLAYSLPILILGIIALLAYFIIHH
jgi:predicted RNase H-like nuclease (RuvC/YqgF family)